LEVYCHPWTAVQICTVQEEHGQKRRLIRVRYRHRLRVISKIVAIAGLLVAATIAAVHLAVGIGLGLMVSAGIAVTWWQGIRRHSRAVELVDRVAGELGLTGCRPPQ
jgi:hypothetical protein